MKADQERVSKLLTDTVTLLCKNGLIYKDEIKIQGLLGITLDKNDVFIVHINETIGSGGAAKDSTSDGTGKKGSLSGVPVVDLTRVADTPVMPAPMRGMGPLGPGMSQQPIAGGSGAGSGVMSARKQRPLMPQMVPRGQYMPMPRFRMGMSPANMHAMTSTMNSHVMYSRQPGVLSAMPQMRQRLPVAPHLATPSRRQLMQHPATVAIDDDEDVVIIGTGHEEPSPNWNSPVRRNHQGRSNNQQVQQPCSQTKSPSSISISSAATVSSAGSADVDQLPVTVTLTENASADPSSTEISLGELSTDGSGQRKLVPITSEGVVEDQMSPLDIASVTSAMLIEPNDQDSDVDNVNSEGDSGVREKSANEKRLSETAASNDGNANETNPSELEIGAKANPDTPSEGVLVSGENTDKTGKDDDSIFSKNSSMILSTEGEQLPGMSQQTPLPVVYTDIADDPEPLQFEGVQVTDMDIQTLGFDILTEDDHDVCHSSSQLGTWSCKVSDCNASFGDASSLASHYTSHHTDRLDLLPNPCSAHTATDSSASEGSERGSLDGVWCKKLLKVMPCPFAGCPNKFSSWPGLYLHHKKVHGASISKTERNKILAMCGKPYKCAFTPACQKSYFTKKELSRHIMKVHDIHDELSNIPPASITNSTSTPVSPESKSPIQLESATCAIKNFLCLAKNCEVVCNSREALVEHLLICHGTVSAPEVKEETAEDQ